MTFSRGRAMAMGILATVVAGLVAVGDTCGQESTATDDHADAAAMAFDLDAVVLRPRFVEGRTSRYEVWTRRDSTQTLTIAGQSRELTTSYVVEGQVTWTIERVRPDGSAQASMTMDWLMATFQQPDGTQQVVDSRRARGDIEQAHALLKAMTSGSVHVEVAADGSITGVSGLDALRRRAGADVSFPEELDFIESATDLATLAAAPPTLAVGRSWDTHFRWTHELGHIEHPMRYTLEAVEPIAGIPVAIVQGTSRARLDLDRSRLPADGPPIEVRLTDGGYDAQIMFDLSRGEAVGRNTIETRQFDVTVRLPQQALRRNTHETIHSQVLRIAE